MPQVDISDLSLIAQQIIKVFTNDSKKLLHYQLQFTDYHGFAKKVVYLKISC